MREFDFNISASVKFDLDTNSSRSLQQVSQDIMKEISSDLQMFQKLSEPLTYLSLVLLACAFLRSVYGSVSTLNEACEHGVKSKYNNQNHPEHV